MSISISPREPSFQRLSDVKRDFQNNKTTLTQKVRYGDHNYNLKVTIDNINLTDQDQINAHMKMAIEKVKLVAKSINLGTEVKDFTISKEAGLSAKNLLGHQVSSEQLKSKLNESKDKLEKIQENYKSDPTIPAEKLVKLERRIQALSQLSSIIDKKARENPVSKNETVRNSIIEKTHSFKTDNETIKRQEVVTASDQRSRLEAHYTERLILLNDKISKENDPEKIKELKYEIQSIKKQVLDLRNNNLINDDGVFGSNLHRDHNRTKAKEIMRANNGKITADEFKKIQKSSSAGMINARTDVLKSEDGKTEVSILRLGALTDSRNGSVSLVELKMIIGGDERTKAEVLKRIEKLEKKFRFKKIFKKDAIGNAALQLARKELENPIEALKNRTERMETLMLLYIEAQARQAQEANKLDGLKSGDAWTVADVRLLNPKKTHIENGCILVESVMIDDMRAMFKEFNGKNIIFDKKCVGAYKDDEGNVHLPASILGEGAEEKMLKLNAHMFNVSVQVHKKNDSVQKEINDEAIGNLEKNISNKEDWDKAKKVLDAGKSNATAAVDLTQALLQSGVTVSLGCFAGKDRTGWIAGLVMIKNMVKELPGKMTNSVSKLLTQDLIKPDSVLMRVINKNKAQRSPSVDPWEVFKEAGPVTGIKSLVGALRDRLTPLRREKINPTR